MNINNLELKDMEYIDGKSFMEATLRSKEVAIKMASKDLEEALPFFTTNNEKKFNITIEVESDDHPYTRTSQNYCWALIDRLATAMNKKKMDMYLQLLLDYSPTTEQITIKESAFNDKALEKVGIKLYQEIGRGMLKNGMNVTVRVPMTMHDMTQAQLNSFIECVKNECADIGISTDTPSERALYGEKHIRT